MNDDPISIVCLGKSGSIMAAAIADCWYAIIGVLISKVAIRIT